MSCKQKKKRYSVLFATIDKTPYAGGEWFRIGMDEKDYATFKDAMNHIGICAERQVTAYVTAMLGRNPKRAELKEKTNEFVERPTDSTLLVKFPNTTTLYKVCGREAVE